MSGPNLSLLTGIVGDSLPSIKLAIISVLAAFVAAPLVYKCALMLISAIRGEGVMYAGRMYDHETWQIAMTDLKRQERSGVALDAESRRALRKHQGLK